MHNAVASRGGRRRPADRCGRGRPHRFVRGVGARSLAIALAFAASLASCDGDHAATQDSRAARQPAAGETPPAGTIPSVPLVALRDIVSSGAFVGRAVRVNGRCLAPPSERPLGPFPSGLGEWQLESDGLAIYIVGQPPRVCAGLAGGAAVTVTGIVAEDTLPALGDLPPAPRRYLVQTVAQPD